MAIEIRNNLLHVSSHGKTMVFDEYVEEEEGGYIWVTICKDCMRKLRGTIEQMCKDDEACIDDFGSGCCSVRGCSTPDFRNMEDDSDWDSVYVDFILDKKLFRGEE